jgi:GDP-L-fucose synthase
MMRMLLTGASGFTGRNLYEKLSVKHSILAPGHDELDLTCQRDVDRYFESHDIDLVIHTAIKPMHRNAKDRSDLMMPNLSMYYNLEKNTEARGVRMFVTGSGSCYGHENYMPMMSEEYFGRHVPASVEGMVKYAVSKHILSSSNIYDLRIFGLFGKYEDYAIRFISNAICKSLFGLPITLRQDRRFHYLCIDDLADIIDAMMLAGMEHHAYNITPDTPVTLLELAEAIKKEMKSNCPIIVAETGFGAEYTGDNSRFKAEFPNVKFSYIIEKVKELIAWYRANKDMINQDLLLSDR